MSKLIPSNDLMPPLEEAYHDPPATLVKPMTDQPTITKPPPAVDEWLDPPIAQAYMGRAVVVKLDTAAVEKAGHAYYHVPVAVLVCENKLMPGLNPVPLAHNWVRSWKPL